MLTVFGKLYQEKHGEVGMMQIVLRLLGGVRFMLSVKLKHKINIGFVKILCLFNCDPFLSIKVQFDPLIK